MYFKRGTNITGTYLHCKNLFIAISRRMDNHLLVSGRHDRDARPGTRTKKPHPPGMCSSILLLPFLGEKSAL